MKFSPYPKYKSNDIKWLTDIPEHWSKKRGRFCIDVNPQSKKVRRLTPDQEVSFVPMEAVGEYGGLNLEQTRTISDVGSGYTEFERGDVVVAKITPCFENGKGALASGLVNDIAFGTTELHVLRATKAVDPQLLFYFTISQFFRGIGEGEMYGAGGQKRVPPEFCKNIQIPLPPLPEQRAIADFLDRETAKIDRLVAKKRTLIERLIEKRIALISRTVTRGLPPIYRCAAGLNPNPKLKPSGIDWLDDVPEHWRIVRVNSVFRLRSGGTPSTDVVDFWNGDIPWVSAKDMKTLRIEDTEDHITERAVKESATSIVPFGTVLVVTRSGILRHSLPVAIAQRPLAINQDIKGLSPTVDNINTIFFAYWVQGNQDPLLTFWRQQGATVESLNVETIKASYFPLPSAQEQQTIVDFLDQETAKIDKLVSKIETAIDRLREYRAALITAAVTGKIDVRKAVL